VKQFREDELEHHDTGVNHEAEMTPGFVFLSKAIKQACYLAIKVTKKY
jgi:ubiquinone biosynthesis monooxygenase Coq7